MAGLVDKAKEFVADKIAHVKKPEADLTDISVQKVTRDSVVFAGKLSISNPNNHSIPICEISYSILSAGREIASGTMSDPGSLLAEETTVMDISFKVPYDFQLSLMRDVGRDWDIDYEMKVGLTIDLTVVGNFTVAVSKMGEMKRPTLSDIF